MTARATSSPTVDRLRAMLPAALSTREVSMFGGLSFMVNDKLVVNVRRDGALLLRVDPRRSPELVSAHGARIAEMGAGRSMGPSWLAVDAELTATEERLRFWLDAALEFNDRLADGPGGSRARGQGRGRRT